MNSQRKIPSNLLELDNALGTYLDEMLFQATEVVRSEDRPVVVPLTSDELLPEVLVTGEVEVREVVTDSPEPELPKNQAAVDPNEQTAEDQALLSRETFPLQCLMFRVSGNLLAVPLTGLTGIVEWSEQLTRLPGAPDWVLGILNHREQNIRILDSASVLQIKSTDQRKPSHVLVLGEEGWGITCDHLEKVVTIEYEDIQWHPEASGRMVSGTVRQTLSSLLNPQGIIKNLQTGL